LSAGEARLRELFVRGLAGEASAYHAFLKELTGYLRAFLRKRLAGFPDDVEDLVQEALLAVHNQRHTYDSRQPLTAWVHAIAKYKLVDFFRRRASRDALTESLEETELEFLSNTASEATDTRRDLAKLLDLLPDRQRLPIVHVKLQGLSVVEAAHITGMSESAIKVGVHRGLKALAARMRKGG